jgi:hypothetical protein
MGIKWKREQCGYDRQKILIIKIVTWDYFYMYPTSSPVTSMVLGLSWLVVIIPSGLWQA